MAFILVPGAWLGGWCWRRVVPVLEAQGHTVLTPTLTGLGERSHLISPDVDLETHIHDVVNVLTWEDLEEVVLVGHSYAGFVVAGVTDWVPERVAKLVFLDTSIPADGESFFDLWSPEGRLAVEAAAAEHGGWPTPDDRGEDAADISHEDMEWVRSKATPHPLGTLAQPLSLNNPAAASIPRGYLCCQAGREQFGAYLQPYRGDRAWKFVDIDSGHWPMISAPEDLARALMDVAT